MYCAAFVRVHSFFERRKAKKRRTGENPDAPDGAFENAFFEISGVRP